MVQHHILVAPSPAPMLQPHWTPFHCHRSTAVRVAPESTTMSLRYLTTLAATLVVGASATVVPAPASAQLPRVGIIDFYGLRKITAAQVREALGINVGDSLTAAAMFEVPARLADLPGVVSAAIDPVCCEDGKTMLYVGVAEEGRRLGNGAVRRRAQEAGNG